MKIKTRNTLDSWENPAWLPKKPKWEYHRHNRVRQTRTANKTRRESFIDQMRERAKIQLNNERQRLGIKTTSHRPATIAELLGNPLGA